MQIRYIAYSSFHQTHFGPVRHRLQGQSLQQLKQLEPSKPELHKEAPALFSADFLKRLGETSAPVIKKSLHFFLNAIIGISVVVTMFIVVPYLYYQFAPSETEVIKTYEAGTPVGGKFDQGAQGDPEATARPSPTPAPLPPQDPNLPQGNWVIIPRIGVRTELQATEDPETALATSVWMAPDYGRPGDKDKPVILAAHRFGWQWWWQTDYWKYHSFYLLPELKPGDIVETIVDQRKYTYEIYAGEEGEEISDYYADMILYTCKHLSSPLRHFRYARMIDWSKDTQSANQPSSTSTENL